MFPGGNHQSCSEMILSETSLLTIIPWVSLRSTHGYKQIIPNGKKSICHFHPSVLLYLYPIKTEN